MIDLKNELVSKTTIEKVVRELKRLKDKGVFLSLPLTRRKYLYESILKDRLPTLTWLVENKEVFADELELYHLIVYLRFNIETKNDMSYSTELLYEAKSFLKSKKNMIFKDLEMEKKRRKKAWLERALNVGV